MQYSLRKVTLRVVVYYAITVLGLHMLLYHFPESMRFLPVGGIEDLKDGSLFSTNPDTPDTLDHASVQLRVFTLFISLIGTIIFTVPLGWVYSATHEKKKQKDSSLLETLFLLPIIVACVVIIVQNSIALAFSLVGIVAAVRFRNTLKSPTDAVYVFASLSIGLSAGVSEIGIAGIASMVFSFTVLGLRYFKIVNDVYPKEDSEKQTEQTQHLPQVEETEDTHAW